MKIRSNFVSNSSSTSFIIRAENDFSTVKDVAKYIMQVCEKEWKLYNANERVFYQKELKTLENISDPNKPMYFDTGSEDTYIRKYEDKIIIRTTQNANFEAINNIALEKDDLSKDFYEYFNYYSEEVDDDGQKELFIMESPYDFDYYQTKFYDFLMLKLNIVGRKVWIDDCPHCKRNISHGVLLQNGKTYCECKIDQVIRKEKLKNIKEIIENEN